METRHFLPGEGIQLAKPTGYDDDFHDAARRSLRLSKWTTRITLPPTLELPTDRPTIVAANHSSLFDIAASLITLSHFGASARLAVASRFFERPMMGSFLQKIGCIPFSRESAAEAEQAMITALEGGQLCCLMPEGRVVKPADRFDGVVGQGRPGVSRIACAAGAAVLPVGFTGADRAWRPGAAIPRIRNRSPLVVRIGEPFVFDGDNHEANANQLMTAIAALVERPGVSR